MPIEQAPLPPAPWTLARALRGRPGLAVLVSDPQGALSPDDARFSFVACDPIERSTAWVPEGGPPRRGWGGFPAAPRWIGAIPYEAGRSLERPAWTRTPDTRRAPLLSEPAWNRYAAVARVDHATGRVAVEGDSVGAVRDLVRALARGLERPPSPASFHVQAAPLEEPDDAHVARVREALRWIREGDIYQVNLARRIPLRVTGDRLELFAALASVSPAPYAFFAELSGVTIASTTPELALEVRGDRIRTAPIKGTRPRGRHAEEDRSLAQALDADPKERAELTMAIDLHRNDVGRVAAIGSVRVLGPPRVLAGRTVWSRVAQVVGRRAAGVSTEAIVRALLPCGSVTGAPKVRAMEIIATLEPFRRGVYTGGIGYVGADGDVVLAMAIRTLEIAPGGEAYYATGGGIVADSDPARELEETRWKAEQLTRLSPHRPSP